MKSKLFYLKSKKLKTTIKAHVQDARWNRLYFGLAGGGIRPLARACLLLILADFLAIAGQTGDAVRPSHRLNEIVAGFGTSELFAYVYQVHLHIV